MTPLLWQIAILCAFEGAIAAAGATVYLLAFGGAMLGASVLLAAVVYLYLLWSDRRSLLRSRVTIGGQDGDGVSAR